MGDLVLIRILFIVALGAAAYFLKPFYLEGIPAIAVGVLAGIGVVFFELRIQKVSLRQLIGAAFGSILGILGAYLISLVIGHAMPASDNTIPFPERISDRINSLSAFQHKRMQCRPDFSADGVFK